jgi:glutaredoxin
MELKEQIKGELFKQKEEKLKKEKELNSKLKKITLYTLAKNTVCENYKKTYNEMGIKFEEKDITIYPVVSSTVQINSVPVISVNDNYLVHGRDFHSPQQSIGAVRHFANPDYVNPPFEARLLESIKNLNQNISKTFQGMNRQLAPISKLMNDIMKDVEKEKKPIKKSE